VRASLLRICTLVHLSTVHLYTCTLVLLYIRTSVHRYICTISYPGGLISSHPLLQTLSLSLTSRHATQCIASTTTSLCVTPSSNPKHG
jgi:hypothetical protein